jgi:membrane protein DedA with SNARE-associated domain
VIPPTLVAAGMVAATAVKPLPGPFQHLEPTLRHWGYLAVAFVLLVENFGIPLPGEALLIAASLYAGTGRLNIFLVTAVAIAASIGGACIGYVIGARGGRRLVERYGRAIRLTPERIDRVEKFFDRRGGWLIVLGRFVEGVRQLLSIIVGMSEMSFKRFLTFTTVGSVLWCCTWSGVGYFAGDHVETVSRYFTYFAVGVAVIVAASVTFHLMHRRRRSA